MTTSKFIRKLLCLQDLVVTAFEFRERGRELVLDVNPWGQSGLCPECQRRGELVASTPAIREWRDVSVLDAQVVFRYQPREIHCPTHGRRQEWIPFAAPSAQVTHRLDYLIIHHCKAMTQKAAAELLHLAPSTLSDLLHRVVTRVREGHRIRGLRKIGIDEISFRKGHKYATIVYDLEKRCVLWVGEGKGRETIDRFFREALTKEQCQAITEASCDMSEAYMGAIKEHCPNATLTLDRFHLVKGLQDAVDEVRKEAWREADQEDKGFFKGLRWLLRRHQDNRSKGQTRTLNKLRTFNRHIWRAWILKDEFDALFDYVYPGSGKKALRSWVTSARKSRLEPLRTFANTVMVHFDDIVSFIETRLTNAVAEGLNRVIRMAKNRASGFRSLDPFADIIYLIAGDVDIQGKIPVKFRTF
jgi:transposase